jgi:hypothetical protein
MSVLSRYFDPIKKIWENAILYHKKKGEFQNFELSDRLLEIESFIMWKYLRKWHKRRILKTKFASADELVKLMDPIPKELIAQFLVEEAYVGAPKFAQEIMIHALPDDSDILNNNKELKEAAQIERRDLKTFQEILNRKGAPKSETLFPLVAEAVHKALAGADNLFERDEGLTKKWREWKVQHEKYSLDPLNFMLENGDFDPYKYVAFVSLFVVDKTTKFEDPTVKEEFWKFHQRIILDARVANAQLKNKAKMEVFTLEALLQRVGNLMQTEKKSSQVFAFQADLRHWFHQIPLPRRYRQYMRMDLGGERCVHYARTWPMGFMMSHR